MFRERDVSPEDLAALRGTAPRRRPDGARALPRLRRLAAAFVREHPQFGREIAAMLSDLAHDARRGAQAAALEDAFQERVCALLSGRRGRTTSYRRAREDGRW